MSDLSGFNNFILKANSTNFEQLALKAFAYQFDNNNLYQQYCKLNKILHKEKVISLHQIPFLPIQFFKSKTIVTKNVEPEIVFKSSSTSGLGQSNHFVHDINLYKLSFTKTFEQFYGDIKNYCFLALLPSYLEREGSSLIYMCNQLIKESNHEKSGFYLKNHVELFETLNHLKKSNQKTILLGATFGLLDFIDTYQISFPELIVIETGGMKGRKKEIIRRELHQILQNSFGTSNVHAEYSMTELLSQAYSVQNGIFECPPWMRIMISDTTDPFSFVKQNKTGVINIIDLANIHSCCFIQTQDVGKLVGNEAFEILGRLDHSETRGCSLLTV